MSKKKNFFTPLGPLYPDLLQAYSFRKVEPRYIGPCIRVLRSSDATELDIGFIAGVLDTTTLTSFVGAGDGHITRWYNQGVYGGYASIVTGNGFKIIDTGVLNTLNGKPVAIRDTGYYAGAYGSFNNNETRIFVGKHSVGANVWFLTGSTGRFVFFNSLGTSLRARFDGIQGIWTQTVDSINQTIMGWAYTLNTPARMDYQGTDLGTQAMTNVRETPQFGNSGIQYQELLMYTTNYDTNLGALCDDVNSFYGAY